MIYLDNAATTRMHESVLEEMLPFLTGEYGNPGSIYHLGKVAKNAIDVARERVAKLMGTSDQSKIVFTSSGTEANNMALEMSKNFMRCFDDYHIIIGAGEHQSTYQKAINGMGGLVNPREKFTYSIALPNEDGIITKDIISNAITDNTGFVSVMHANNETGTYNDIDGIADLCVRTNSLYHADCVQSAGCEDILADERHLSFASISSHKLHGPKGVGALYVFNKAILTPFIYGGKEQEYGLRAGTQNVASIVGFGKACEIAYENLEENKNKLEELKNTFLYELQYAMKNNMQDGLRKINFCSGNKTISLRFEGIDAETLVILLDSVYKTVVSSGSACDSHKHEPSRVLTAYGLTPEEAMQTIRVSFSCLNTIDEVRKAAHNIANAVRALHK